MKSNKDEVLHVLRDKLKQTEKRTTAQKRPKVVTHVANKQPRLNPLRTPLKNAQTTNSNNVTKIDNTAKPIDKQKATKLINRRKPWYGYKLTVWNTMSARLLAKPETNYRFWDEAEVTELHDYLTRFYQEDQLVGSYADFRQNWANAAAAFKYSQTDLKRRFYVDPEEELELGFKGAIRVGVAVEAFGSFLEDADALETIGVMRAMIDEM